MKVVEIFESIDGEGIRVGFPVTFIRLYGCNLHCSYCDSQYACVGGDYTDRSIYEILQVVNCYGHKFVTLTGGEPLIHADVKELIDALVEHGYEVNIETDGAVSILPYIQSNVLITLDYKCPSSGMEYRMLPENFRVIRDTDVVKFVVGSQEDLLRAQQVIDEYKLHCNIYLSPVFGAIEPKEIVGFILRKHLENVRMQLQIHKFIWEPDKRGV